MVWELSGCTVQDIFVRREGWFQGLGVWFWGLGFRVVVSWMNVSVL